MKPLWIFEKGQTGIPLWRSSHWTWWGANKVAMELQRVYNCTIKFYRESNPQEYWFT